MKKLGIIQPEKIGDIIICLPIAKYYYDRGYEVIWPINRNIINNFVNYVDYVTFIPIDSDCRIAAQVCYNEMCNKVIDLAFCIPGANSRNTDWYLNHNDTMSFDELKYHIAEVPFNEKWNLQIKRNDQKEQIVLDSLILIEELPFIVMQDKSSDSRISYNTIGNADNPTNTQLWVNIHNITDSIFDWIPVLEKATGHWLIESCFSNLVDQLQIKVTDQKLFLKHGYYGSKLNDGHLRGIPRLRLDWTII